MDVLVAGVVPIGAVGVVRVADVVDVALFHQKDFTQYLSVANGMAVPRIGFVAVDTFQLHRLVVDIEVAASFTELIVLRLRVADLHRANAEIS